MSGYHVHLVGSVPLRNAKEVFQTMAQELGTLVDRLPDGETGERSRWMGWLDHIFAENPQFEPTGSTFKAHETADETVRYRLAPGVTPGQIRFDNLRHAMIALDSYREFARLKAERAPSRPGANINSPSLIPCRSFAAISSRSCTPR